MKEKTCIRCGGSMVAGMLPGWHICRQCEFFMDIQMPGEYNAIIQYSIAKQTGYVTVPKGCLLVVDGKELCNR